MSWQGYVDTNLVGTGKVSKAAIVGHKGGVWAKTSDFALTREEETAIVGAFDKKEQTQASGLRLAGAKYFTLSIDQEKIAIIQLKRGPDGAVIVKTKQAFLVAAYQAPIQAPEATNVVVSLAEYLIGVGY
ncbi:hypothetical protein APHAL10511_004020 [Amanita phalloides]|nr:hypothetical protein APHAL10511_004020 [Amanita phalloides]